ncbi:MAG: hypothetical protein WEB58_07880 [Planctomycetaceae bacterium]
MLGRRPSFVMSTCLMMAISLCGCGERIDRTKQQEAAEAIFRAGGALKLQDSDIKLTSVDELPQEEFIIGSVDLNQTSAADDELKVFEGMTTIQYMGLHSTYVTDAGVDHLRTLKGLQEVELSYTAITDQALQVLAELPALKKVFIYDTAVTDAGMEEFKKKRPKCLIVR